MFDSMMVGLLCFHFDCFHLFDWTALKPALALLVVSVGAMESAELADFAGFQRSMEILALELAVKNLKTALAKSL